MMLHICEDDNAGYYEIFMLCKNISMKGRVQLEEKEKNMNL